MIQCAISDFVCSGDLALLQASGAKKHHSGSERYACICIARAMIDMLVQRSGSPTNPATSFDMLAVPRISPWGSQHGFTVHCRCRHFHIPSHPCPTCTALTFPAALAPLCLIGVSPRTLIATCNYYDTNT